ncbi:MAG TPA: hypothetical protein VJ917_09525 [Saprospiraceae bacterium]|nr:hypothetical protein [Saprospiraceae bacterium]
MLAILGVVMYLAILFLIYAIQDRMPDRFEELRMPENAFLKLRVIVSIIYLSLLPAMIFLVRIYQQLTDYFKGQEEALIKFYKSLRFLFLSLLLAWIVFVIFTVVSGNYIMDYKLAFRNLPIYD